METTVEEMTAETEEDINIFFLQYKRDQRKLIPFFVSSFRFQVRATWNLKPETKIN